MGTLTEIPAVFKGFEENTEAERRSFLSQLNQLSDEQIAVFTAQRSFYVSIRRTAAELAQDVLDVIEDLNPPPPPPGWVPMPAGKADFAIGLDDDGRPF
jgi:hypothetical protein